MEYFLPYCAGNVLPDSGRKDMNTSKIGVWGVLLGLALTCLSAGSVLANSRPADYKANGSIALIEKAYSDGKLTLGDKIFRELQAVMAPQDLPSSLASSLPEIVKCGTPYVEEALANWRILTGDQQALATQYLARPNLDSTYISPSHAFAIHYSRSGNDAVPLEDLNLNNIPDYVERIGQYMDSVYHFYHTTLGYLPHPRDNDSLYDVYLLKIAAYGITVQESPGDSAWEDYSSYIQIHCNFVNFPPNDDPEGDVIGAQKVTCAHEYYHATQMAYNANMEAWWRESAATYFEEVSYPEVNDNYGYLPTFFNYPDTFLTAGGYHMYSAFIWPQYLAAKFSLNILRTIAERQRFYSILASIDSSLAPLGKTVKGIFPEFTVWNYFTGPRTGGITYDSAADYPPVPLDRSLVAPFAAITPIYAPDGLAANYIMAYPESGSEGLLKIGFDGANTVEWGFSYVAFRGSTVDVHPGCAVDAQGRTSCGIYDIALYDSVLFVPAVVSQWLNNNQYSFTATINPFGDADGNGSLNILDVSYLINYLYRYGTPPKYDYFIGDANCSGNVNILDVSYIIKNLYREGPSPCPYRP
ncbi:hypothetical protein TRIP_C21633 [Candidatus Zixiibacteriota bacterium]|nr:hypothetical protein TRIP_C21633 [candidate division Zixibacteria bacterium]